MDGLDKILFDNMLYLNAIFVWVMLTVIFFLILGLPRRIYKHIRRQLKKKMKKENGSRE